MFFALRKGRAWRCAFQLLDLGIGAREQHLVSCNAALSGLKGSDAAATTAMWHKATALLHKMHRGTLWAGSPLMQKVGALEILLKYLHIQ